MEDRLRHPAPGGAIAAARDFGVDLTLLIDNLRKTPDLPFLWDAATLRNGLNFTLATDAGGIDLLGEIAGVGDFHAAYVSSVEVIVAGNHLRMLSLETLIRSKRAAGRPKDLVAVVELEALLEASRNN